MLTLSQHSFSFISVCAADPYFCYVLTFVLTFVLQSKRPQLPIFLVGLVFALQVKNCYGTPDVIARFVKLLPHFMKEKSINHIRRSLFFQSQTAVFQTANWFYMVTSSLSCEIIHWQKFC